MAKPRKAAAPKKKAAAKAKPVQVVYDDVTTRNLVLASTALRDALTRFAQATIAYNVASKTYGPDNPDVEAMREGLARGALAWLEEYGQPLVRHDIGGEG